MKTAVIVTVSTAAILLFWYFFSGVVLHAFGILILNFVGSDIFLTMVDKVINLISVLVMG